jgi:outer membrane putative beta-barrel porin/alpha-amylase
VTTGRRHLAETMTIALFVLLAARIADAQQSVSDVLSFLVTNRSIPTGDFVRDEEAAIATRDTISKLLVLELATLPSSSGGGFTYRLDPTLGTVIRASDSFGPLFTERSLLAGRGRASFGMSFSSVSYDNIDGRNLRDGTLVSTASVFHGETTPFDIETVTLKFRTDTVTLNGTVGITDQLEISAGIPFIRLNLEGERIDNYRGQQLLQARGSASTAGLGDIVVRGRYNVYRSGASGMAVGAEVRLPTGNEEDLLGTGSTSFTPRFIGSYEQDRVGLHGEIGYTLRGVSEALTYAGAVTAVAAPRLTLVGELLGRRLNAVGRLVETTLPHPRLTGVDTVRLTSSDETADRLLLVGGFKWNIASTWLLTANVLRPLTDVGLNARWVPSVTFDYWFD